MTEGYNRAAPSDAKLTYLEMFSLNIYSEFSDIYTAVNASSEQRLLESDVLLRV